jgi:hypothetical protein
MFEVGWCGFLMRPLEIVCDDILDFLIPCLYVMYLISNQISEDSLFLTLGYILLYLSVVSQTANSMMFHS